MEFISKSDFAHTNKNMDFKDFAASNNENEKPTEKVIDLIDIFSNSNTQKTEQANVTQKNDVNNLFDAVGTTPTQPVQQ